MPRFTRLIKRNRKNKTFKKGGTGRDEERKGVLDIVGDKIGNVTSSVVNKASDISLNALGLEKIDKSKQISELNKHVDVKNDYLTSGIISNVGKTSSAVIDNVNEVLDSPFVSKNVIEAGKETAAITGKLAEKFNETMDDPIIKAEVQEAIENAGEIGTVIAKASEEPIKEIAKVGVESGTKALGAAASGFIKVGTDMLAAIPGVGSIIEIGKILNDGSKAVSSVVEAGSEAIETTSDAFIETSEKVKESLKELEEKKKISEQISNRTLKSINQFENPLQNTLQKGGGRKTKRHLFNRKSKSKRVRFA